MCVGKAVEVVLVLWNSDGARVVVDEKDADKELKNGDDVDEEENI